MEISPLISDVKELLLGHHSVLLGDHSVLLGDHSFLKGCAQKAVESLRSLVQMVVGRILFF